MKTTKYLNQKISALVLTASLLSFTPAADAANIYKTNNVTALNVAGSWTNNVVPGGLDTAIWDTPVATAANCTNVLGGNMTWGGLTVINPVAPVQISADGNTLTLTNLTMTSATVNLTLNCGLSVGGSPTWQIGSSAATPNVLTIGSAMTGSGNIKQQYGKIKLAPSVGALPSTMNYSWSGTGTLDLGGNSQTLYTLGTPWAGTGIVSNGNLTLSLSSGDFNPAPHGLNSIQDLSGLSAFTVNNLSRNFTFNDGDTVAGTYTLYFYFAATGSGTNFIAVNAFNCGSGGNLSSGTSPVSYMYLGKANLLNVNTIQMGGYKGSGALSFKSGLSNPTVKIRGTNGVDRLPSLIAGTCSTGAYAESGVADFTGGTIDCTVTNVYVAQHIAGSANQITGTLTVDGTASSFDALNVTVSQKTGTGAAPLIGTINQLNGTMKIANLVMGDNQGGSAIIKAAYNLSGGTLQASNVQFGAGAVNSGGFSTINWTNGTIKNYDSSTPLIVASGIAISAPGTGSRFFTVDSGLTNTLQNTVSQGSSTASALVKNGAGGLDLQGTTDNAFLSLNVSNGVVLLDKTSSGSVHAIGNGLTLNGGNAVLSGSGGDQIANANIVTINSGTFDVNGQTETIGGLAGSGGTLANSVGSTLTVNVAAGTNYTSASTITSGDLSFGGSGTQIFIGTDSRSSGLTTVNNGVLQIGNGGASGSLQGGSVVVNSPGLLAFNRTGTYQGGGIISGNGTVAQNGSGTLILTNDAHTGSTLINTGTLAVPTGASTIAGSVITVASGANFNTTAGSGFYIQANQILNGSGTVTGDYVLSTGATNSGNLAVTGNVILADGSVFNPGAAFTAGTITVTGNVTFSGGNPNLIYNLASTTTPGGGTNSLLTVSGTLDLSALGAGALNLYIHGTPASGTYVLATASSIVGSASAITVNGSTRYTYTPQIVGNQLRLVVVGNAGNLTWLGDGAGNIWDANNGANLDWTNNTSHLLDFFNTGDNALFNDLSANPNVNISGTILPASLTVNASINYTFADAGSGVIDGPIALTKTNSGTLTIQNNNTFTGPVNVNGGTVSVASVAPTGGAQPLGAGSALNLNGGTFQYTGAAVGVGGFTRNITLGANGGTIDQESTSGIYFFITNKITGTGSLTKAGSQQLILGDGATGTGSNDYSGITYINNGNVQIRNAYALGSPSAKTVINSGATLSADGGSFTNIIPENIDLAGGTLQGAGGTPNYGGTITVVSNSVVGGSQALAVSGPIVGAASIDKLGSGTFVVLSTNSSFTGGFTNDAGTTQLGNGTQNGTLPGDITLNAGTLSALPVSGTMIVLPGPIHGTGQLLVNNLGGTLSLTGSNDWSGAVNINAGNVWINQSAGLGSGTKTVTMVNGTAGNPALHLNGTNGSITLSSNITLNCSWVSGVLFNEAGNNIVQSTISLNAGGGDSLFAVNAGTMDLAGTIGAVQPNRGFLLGGAGNGTVSGSVVDSLGSAPRELKVQGTGTWTVSGTNTTTAPANVSSGKLLINGEWAGPANALTGGTLGGTGDVLGAVSIASGATFSPGASIGTFTANSDLTFSNGASVFIEVNKSLAQSNDLVVVSGALNAGTGTVTVTNLGPTLAAGDKFTLFNQPVANGNLLAVSGGGTGVTWTNLLAVDGSIQVLSVASPVNTNTFVVGAVVSGSNLNLSWPPDRLGWKVQLQTNTLNVGLSSNWFTVPATATVTNYSIPINPANPAVFIRMTYP
jgi:fibronectin-binding autotransporter adhesin